MNNSTNSCCYVESEGCTIPVYISTRNACVKIDNICEEDAHYLDLNMPCLNEDVECFEFCIKEAKTLGLSGYKNDKKLCSITFYKGSDCDTTLFKFRNSHDVYNVVRLAAVVESPEYETDDEIAFNSRSNIRRIYSKTRKLLSLKTKPFGIEMHELFITMLGCDEVYYFDVSMGRYIPVVLKGSYNIEWIQGIKDKIGTGSASLYEGDWEVENAFC